MTDKHHPAVFPQVKICGLTAEDQARECADLGADAIGLIFYPPSPRNVTKDQAQRIAAALPAGVSAVGVFVNPSLDEVRKTVDRCGLTAVQLHGVETPQLVEDLKEVGVPVIKALFADRPPRFETAADYAANAVLVECGRGPLPGGNARIWNWAAAAPLADRFALVLAGGLGSENISAAIAAALPDAVDVSSGVEIRPGIKNLARVRTLIENIRINPIPHRNKRKIFFGKERNIP